jgi:hypothetical protein
MQCIYRVILDVNAVWVECLFVDFGCIYAMCICLCVLCICIPQGQIQFHRVDTTVYAVCTHNL